MAYSKNWDSVDFFHVLQAAWLWCDKNPEPHIGSGVLSVMPLPQDVAAVFQMLCGAIRQSNLPADHSGNDRFYPSLEPVPKDLMESGVTLEDLLVFAKSKNQFPAFLFNTMLPIDVDPLASELPRTAANVLAKKQKPVGRPREYDWDGAIIEIILLAIHPDGLPKTQAEAEAHVSQWFGDTYDKQPAISEVKKLVSRIYNGLKERGWKPGE